MKSLSLFLVLLIILPFVSTAQWMQRLPMSAGVGEDPTNFIVFKGNLYVTAYNGFYGREWYVIDGNHHPKLLFDLNPGVKSGIYSDALQTSAIINDTFYFSGDNGISGFELYGFDGSTTPFIIKDIIPGSLGSSPHSLVELNGKLYFTATEVNSGRKLWCYDPATKQASLLPAINGDDPKNLIAFKDKLYFTAQTDGIRKNLYVYDPASASPPSVIAFDPTQRSYAQNFHIYNGKLYFSASDNIHGAELRAINGTNHVELVKNIAPGNWSTFELAISKGIGSLNNQIFFSGQLGGYVDFPQLMRLDTLTKQVIIDTLRTGSDAEILGFATYHNKVYFKATADAGGGLFYSDGINKPVKVSNVHPNMYFGNMQWIVYNDWLYFKGNGPGEGTALYRYHDTKTSAAVQNVFWDAETNFYPNPTHGYSNLLINLKQAEDLLVTINSILGQTVYKTGIRTFNPGSNVIAIDLLTNPPGQYYYSIYSAAGELLLNGKIEKN